MRTSHKLLSFAISVFASALGCQDGCASRVCAQHSQRRFSYLPPFYANSIRVCLTKSVMAKVNHRTLPAWVVVVQPFSYIGEHLALACLLVPLQRWVYFAKIALVHRDVNVWSYHCVPPFFQSPHLCEYLLLGAKFPAMMSGLRLPICHRRQFLWLGHRSL